MKKLVYSLFIISFAGSCLNLKAQDDDKGDKKVKMGIIFTPAVNWLSPDNVNKEKSNGAVVKAGIGLAVDFRLTSVIWFHTGLEYTGAGGKLSYTQHDTGFYYYNNDAIVNVSVQDAGTASSTANSTSTYKKNILLTRNMKVGYLHVPLGFRLKTKEIGGITYFGQIGGDLFFRTSAKGDDQVTQWNQPYSGFGHTGGTAVDLKGNNINGSINFFNAAANVGFGLEYRISGSTAVIASLAYRHGITNFTAKDNDYLLKSTSVSGVAPYSQFENAVKLRQVVLTVGIMF